MFDIKENWDFIKDTIRKEYDITNVSFKTWIEPLSFNKMEGNVVYIKIPKEQSNLLKYITKKYKDCFMVTISELAGLMVDIVFTLDDADKEVSVPAKEDPILKNNLKKSNLIEKYNFENFIQGDTNRFAYSAALAVADNPGTVYNPLYIYGGPGLGKTHLMHSIGHYILENNPDMNILYVASDVFTNEVIEGIRAGNASVSIMTNLREKYSSVDVFLIDDIQYIIGKESTQKEFFNIFNTLHNANKQIVISSDKPPRELETLEERFVSRFEWGLTADIKPPDYETRMAILRKNKENTGKTIDDEVLNYIANNVKSNIRELEGALNRLVAFMNLNNLRSLNMEHALEALKDIIYPDKAKSLTLSYIIEKVAEEYNISPDEILSQKRNSEIVEPRHIAMYLCRTLTDSSLITIAKKFNRKDHSTVNHAADKIAIEVEKNGEIKRRIDSIKRRINPAL